MQYKFKQICFSLQNVSSQKEYISNANMVAHANKAPDVHTFMVEPLHVSRFIFLIS